MIGRYNLRLICLVLVIHLSASGNLIAQNSSLEIWPETDIWYRLDSSWRLSSFIALSKNVESKYRELSVLVQADYAWGHLKRIFKARLLDDTRAQTVKAWMARGGLMEGGSLGDHADNYTEDMVFAELHRRMPLKGNVLLSQRLRGDFRWLSHDPVEYSYRIRYRIMAEKEFASSRRSIVPYVSAESFWDSRYSTFKRLRIIGGTTVAWGRPLALEGNITYQYDAKASVTNLYALNIILHLFFETKHSRSNG